MSDPKKFVRRLYERLEASYYIRSVENKQPLPLVSPFHTEGVIVPVYGDLAAAQQKAVELTGSYGVQAEVSPVEPLWDAMRRFAILGFAGVMLDEVHRVHFLNRLSEMDRSLPSLARLIAWPEAEQKRDAGDAGDECSLLFGPGGRLESEGAFTIPWDDFSRLDRTSVRWMLDQNPLPESFKPWTIGANNANYVVFPLGDGASLLGAYVSPVGATPIFSSEGWAAYFGERVGVLRVEQEEGYDVQPVQGTITAHLDRIYADHGPMVDVVLNPFCHRFRQGYFFKDAEYGWCLRTISGIFQIDNGQLIPREDAVPPKGDDVGRGSVGQPELLGVASVTHHPLARLFGKNKSPISREEAKARLKEDFKSRSPEWVEAADFGPDAFALDGFDKVSGDKLSWSLIDCASSNHWGGPLLFRDIVDTCNWLIKFSLPHDEEVRVRGARLCHGGGFPGSQNPEREKGVTRAIRQAIRQIQLDVLTSGYRPEHSIHLQRLFQDATATLEITVAGYLADLAYFGLPESYSLDEDEGQNRTGSDNGSSEPPKFPVLFRQLQSQIASVAHVNAPLFQELREAIGPVFDDLSEDSCVILATAFKEYRQVGKRPGYDYSGISMKLSKVVERELKRRVFEPWRAKYQSPEGRRRLDDLRRASERGPRDDTGSLIVDWLSGRKRLELGSMRFCLKKAGERRPHAAIQALEAYLRSFSDPGWLTSQDLFDRLAEVSNRYRNGGVHEVVVNYDLCVEAIDRLLLDRDSTLARLLPASTQPRI